MNTSNQDILEDKTSHPVKIHLPIKLVEQLNTYCEKTKTSKSEVIRDYLMQGLNTNILWINRLHFFKSRDVDNAKKIQKELKSLPLNTPIKVAVSQIDNPSQAWLAIGYLNSLTSTNITIYIPPYHDSYSSVLVSNAHIELQNILPERGYLCIPEKETMFSYLGQQEKIIYTIPIEYIWDIYTTPNYSTF